jgi:hypothetical protein
MENTYCSCNKEKKSIAQGCTLCATYGDGMGHLPLTIEREIRRSDTILTSYLKYLYAARFKMDDRFYIDTIISNIWKSTDPIKCIEESKSVLERYLEKLKNTVMNGLTIEENEKRMTYDILMPSNENDIKSYKQLTNKYLNPK